MDEPAYQEVLEALNSLISEKPKVGDRQAYESAYQSLQTYLERLDLVSELTKLKVIHVAGTKGKGSTCAMVESMLRQCGYKTGMFTSPHLVDVRERIRLQGRPIAIPDFMQHFWWCFDKLKEYAHLHPGMPAYFRFMTILALKVFLEEKVDVAILEVGVGGRLDATNCIPKPIVCGVTSLGFDHVELLGHTLPEIAREKAGIFKTGVPAFTVQQPEDALQALLEVAGKVQAPLKLAAPFEQYMLPPHQLGLAGAHQQVNASLAVQLAATWEQAAGPSCGGPAAAGAAQRVQQLGQLQLPDAYVEGLQGCVWPGRAQVVRQSWVSEGMADGLGTTFFLDGAHTPESMATCAEWFCEAAHTQQATAGQQELAPHRILLFNCMKERNPEALLRPFMTTLAARGLGFQQALFVPPESSYRKLGSPDHPPKDLSWQHGLQKVYQTHLTPTSTTGVTRAGLQLPALPGLEAGQDGRQGAVLPSLRATLNWLRRCSQSSPKAPLQVLVTGSLYLVGDVLKLLNKAPV
ncbi:hypothetical protein ABBQ32_009302 [Trebouxia sp. C0010 RCD-2024]